MVLCRPTAGFEVRTDLVDAKTYQTILNDTDSQLDATPVSSYRIPTYLALHDFK